MQVSKKKAKNSARKPAKRQLDDEQDNVKRVKRAESSSVAEKESTDVHGESAELSELESQDSDETFVDLHETLANLDSGLKNESTPGLSEFQWMISPLSVVEFFQYVWQRKHVHVRRTASPHYYRSLFSGKVRSDDCEGVTVVMCANCPISLAVDVFFGVDMF